MCSYLRASTVAQTGSLIYSMEGCESEFHTWKVLSLIDEGRSFATYLERGIASIDMDLAIVMI